jgi:hypothetical protein
MYPTIACQQANAPIADLCCQADSSATEGPAIPPADAQGDANRRRLTPDECYELLSRPVAGIFSSQAEGGWIHSVPVHFLHRNGEIRICCGTNSIKAANVDRTGRGTLCVEVTNGSERRYVTSRVQHAWSDRRRPTTSPRSMTSTPEQTQLTGPDQTTGAQPR